MVGPFLRGCAWPAGAGVAYPRADPADFSRLPIDTWATAQFPAGVRVEFVGDAEAVEIGYSTSGDNLGYRGDGAGRTFSLWQGGEKVAEAAAVLGSGTVVLPRAEPAPNERSITYLPEGMRPVVESITPIGGGIEPAPPQPRWLAYGDSIAEGWTASEPALAWPAVTGRALSLDVINLGYAGSARGEMVTAEQLAALPTPAVITISHGTNCWTRIPHSVDMMGATTGAFLDIVRQGHPEVPIVVVSPVVRPDAEATANRLGGTLAALRSAMEEAVEARIRGGDRRLTLVPGRPLLPSQLLADGVHPGDEGHQVLATSIGAAIKEAIKIT
ncbi:MAG TPA: GDSL-type esterase/lipase family protein [Acidimicrobiales bacterium]|nr:GDSL-type esterase/lipase family protein [Acidimicrobiales bacterium]